MLQKLKALASMLWPIPRDLPGREAGDVSRKLTCRRNLPFDRDGDLRKPSERSIRADGLRAQNVKVPLVMESIGPESTKFSLIRLASTGRPSGPGGPSKPDLPSARGFFRWTAARGLPWSPNARKLHENMVALTGIERANGQFGSVQLGLSVCIYVSSGTCRTARINVWTLEVAARWQRGYRILNRISHANSEAVR